MQHDRNDLDRAAQEAFLGGQREEKRAGLLHDLLLNWLWRDLHQFHVGDELVGNFFEDLAR